MPDKPGVATLASALLNQGTTSKDAEQIASAIDSIGGALGTGAGSDLSFVNAVVMKDGLGFALDMVSDVVRHPAFAPEEMNGSGSRYIRAEGQLRQSGLPGRRRVRPPGLRGPSVRPPGCRNTARWQHLARRSAGVSQSVVRREQRHPRDRRRRHGGGGVRGRGARLRVMGKAPNTAPPPVAPPPSTRRVVVMDRPGAVQTEIRVGNIALPRKPEDYLALDLAIKILGGEGGNRLQRVLRSERGLTYGASADTNALRDAGDVVADTDTRTETTGEALRLVVDEFCAFSGSGSRNARAARRAGVLHGQLPVHRDARARSHCRS